jgi:membrane protease subunit HflK
LVYESRLIGLLGQPGGLFKTAAHALDYQFGFKVSDTWFYKFLEQALARLVLLWLAILWLSTAFVFIEPGEQGLLERFGLPVEGRGVLEPGLSFKFPWPIDAVHRYATREVQTFNVGFTPDPEKEKDRTLLWTRPHYKEEVHMLVASRDSGTFTTEGDDAQRVPVNLLIASIPVQYVVADVRAWAYNHADGAQLLERLANREVVRYLASVDMDEIMSYGRLTAATELTSRIQAKADEHKLGVKVTFVGLQDIHPPMGSREEPVAASYEKVIGAIAEKEARILQAQGFYAETLPKAGAEAAKKVDDAKAEAVRKVEVARGQADQFKNQLIAFKAAPNVFQARTKNETISRALAPTRKYLVLSTNAHDVITLNLEQKLRDDLESLNIDPVKKETK